MLILFQLIICATMLLSCLQICTAGNNETDRMALMEIKAKIIKDPLNVMSSWNDTLHFCNWYGITCGQRHQRVTVLDLKSAKLAGNISPFVGNLSFLRILQLKNNSFSGNIPPEIGRLHRLQYLFLNNNSLGGEIPSNISGCFSLIKLHLFFNSLVGKIPPEVGFLSSLQSLRLSVNDLSGTIPSSLGNLSSLYELYVARNNLVGMIPDSLGNSKSLIHLSIPINRLSGIVPPSIFNLSLLTNLDLGENELEGNLPADIALTLPNIKALFISSNRFSGHLPASISNSSNLESLQVTENYLNGPVPPLNKLENLIDLNIGDNFLGNNKVTDLSFVSSLANATILQLLNLNQNNFGGSFPSIICNFSILTKITFIGNNIVGEIPSCIENSVELQLLGGGGNQLSGVIPPGIGRLQNLNELTLGYNRLSGAIPLSIGNLTKLTILSLSNNMLEGKIPSTVGNCRSLVGLDLSRNKFSGKIPSHLLSLSTLSIALDLSENFLVGSLPEEIRELNNLAGLDISSNMLSGEIPSTLGACIALEMLYMSSNLFQGTISDALKTLKGLQELDLSQNNLSGTIPKFLESLPLQKLNLSYNSNLEGQVPIGGVFSNATRLSIAGNSKLCGGIPGLKLSKCKSKSIQIEKPKHKRKLMLVTLFGLIGISLLVALLASFYIFWFKKRSKETIASADSENFPTLSYQSLLKATNGFSSENLIGRGTFGVVYKGNLDIQDPSLVAIKIFNLEHHGASKSFIAECKVLRNIRHRNLVKVITACSSLDHQGNDFKALVYEYMVNGSLEDWLYPEAIGTIEGTDNAPKSLNLQQRLDIAINIATALEYLHHHCGASIVHCDLKPSNVLLDEDMVAHVGDFGLAKFLTKTGSNIHEIQSSTLGFRGTIGYAPPEYGLGNELSTYGDVYSYGILLLEVFTRKRPTCDMFKGGHTLHQFVKEALPGQVTDILDDVLLENLNTEGTNTSTTLEALISVLGIALRCTTEVPRERLDISDVVPKLSSIRNKLLGTPLQQRKRSQASNIR